MDEDALFKVLKKQTKATLLELLSVTYQETTSQQQRHIFGDLMKQSKPYKASGQDILKESQKFYKDSLAGVYYAPFDMNSKNYSHIPEETEEWFEKLGDLLESSAQLAKQQEHAIAVESFKILYELIGKMEYGDGIIFAEEYGSWMIRGDKKDFLDSYISSLAAIETAEGYTKMVIPLIEKDSYSSFSSKAYAIAVKHSNKEQKKSLTAAIKEQNIRTK